MDRVKGWEIYRTPNNWIHTGWINQGIKDCSVNLLHEHCMHVKKRRRKIKSVLFWFVLTLCPSMINFCAPKTEWHRPCALVVWDKAICFSWQELRAAETRRKKIKEIEQKVRGQRERERDEFANVRHKIHTFVGNSCNGRLTEKLEIKFHQLAP